MKPLGVSSRSMVVTTVTPLANEPITRRKRCRSICSFFFALVAKLFPCNAISYRAYPAANRPAVEIFIARRSI